MPKPKKDVKKSKQNMKQKKAKQQQQQQTNIKINIGAKGKQSKKQPTQTFQKQMPSSYSFPIPIPQYIPMNLGIYPQQQYIQQPQQLTTLASTQQLQRQPNAFSSIQMPTLRRQTNRPILTTEEPIDEYSYYEKPTLTTQIPDNVSFNEYPFYTPPINQLLEPNTNEDGRIAYELVRNEFLNKQPMYLKKYEVEELPSRKIYLSDMKQPIPEIPSENIFPNYEEQKIMEAENVVKLTNPYRRQGNINIDENEPEIVDFIFDKNLKNEYEKSKKNYEDRNEVGLVIDSMIDEIQKRATEMTSNDNTISQPISKEEIPSLKQEVPETKLEPKPKKKVQININPDEDEDEDESMPITYGVKYDNIIKNNPRQKQYYVDYINKINTKYENLKDDINDTIDTDKALKMNKFIENEKIRIAQRLEDVTLSNVKKQAYEDALIILNDYKIKVSKLLS